MSAIDYTTLTETNPNALITSISATAINWSGDTDDGGATYVSESVSISGDYTAVFDVSASSYGAYRHAVIFALADTSANPEAATNTHYVKLYWAGSSWQTQLYAVEGGTSQIVSAANFAYTAAPSAVLRMTLKRSGNSLSLGIADAPGSTSGYTASISLTLTASPTFTTLFAFSSPNVTQTGNPWGGAVSNLNFSLPTPTISAVTIDTNADTISGTGALHNTISSITIAAGGGTDTISTGITSTSSSFSAAYTPSHAPFTSSSVDVTATDSTNATASFTTSIGPPTGFQAVVAADPINTDPSQSVLTSSNVAGDQMLTALRDDNNLGDILQNPDGTLVFTWDSGTPPNQTTFKSYIWDSVNALRGSLLEFTVEKGAIVSAKLDNNHFSYFKTNGSTARDFNVAALQYYLANGATAKQFNVALRQAQNALSFRGLSPVDIRNR